MSEENVAAVKAALKFARDGLDGLDEFWTDDIDHRAGEDVLDDCGPIDGKAEMRAYLRDWFDTFDDFRAEPVELIDAGEDQVVAVLRIMGRASSALRLWLTTLPLGARYCAGDVADERDARSPVSRLASE